MSLRLVSAGRTEVGRVRKHNEDAILVRDDLGLWVVADGLGGHSAGDYASGLIVERLGALQRPISADPADFVDAIEDALEAVNVALREHAAARDVDLVGSTVVLLVRAGEHLLCGWVGDSRAYGFEDGALRQLSSDHVQGPATPVPGAPPRQAGAEALSRALGAETELHVDWVAVPVHPGAQYLLCSDGLNKELSDAELEAAFRRRLAPRTLLDGFMEQALARGARDNVSCIVLRVQD